MILKNGSMRKISIQKGGKDQTSSSEQLALESVELSCFIPCFSLKITTNPMGELETTKTPVRDLGILSNFSMFVY